MPFGAATVITTIGKAMFADRVRTTPATYSNAPKYVAMGVGATGAARTAVVGDTALSSEVESRTSGTESIVTTSTTGDTYQVVGTVTASASRAVDEAGLFDASSTGNLFLSATFNVVNLSNGDSIQFTFKAQLT
jgi:hypothetical protein